MERASVRTRSRKSQCGPSCSPSWPTGSARAPFAASDLSQSKEATPGGLTEALHRMTARRSFILSGYYRPMPEMAEPTPPPRPPPAPRQWLNPGVRGIGTASFLSDLGHEVPTSLLPRLVTSTLGGSAAALGAIEGVAEGLAGMARLAGGALADDPERRRAVAVGGYASTAVLSSAIGAATALWQVGVLRAGAWVARGLRVPARNALLADAVPEEVYGKAYGFERAMDNLGAIGGPLLALGLIAAFSVRTAILLSIIPGLLAALAMFYAVRHIP